MPEEDEGTTPPPGDNTPPAGSDDGEVSIEALQEQIKKLEADREKWKGISIKRENEVKELRPKAEERDELVNQGKTAEERLQAELDKANAKAKKLEIKNLKSEVAAKKDLPSSLAKFLPDLDNEVDMMQAADDLIEAAGIKTSSPARQPKSDLTAPLGDDEASEKETLLKAMTGQSTL